MKTKTVNLYEKKLLVTKGINIAKIREGIKYGKLIVFINSNYYVGLKTSYFDRRKCTIFFHRQFASAIACVIELIAIYG